MNRRVITTGVQGAEPPGRDESVQTRPSEITLEVILIEGEPSAGEGALSNSVTDERRAERAYPDTRSTIRPKPRDEVTPEGGFARSYGDNPLIELSQSGTNMR